MPLTLAQLEAIRDECLADDVEIPPESVAWIEAEARAYFESGGAELPRKPGLEGAEVLAYYEVRKPTVHNSSPAFLMDALHTTLYGEDRGGAPAAAQPEAGSLAELRSRGGDVAALRALAASDRAALSEQLRALGYAKLGHRLQAERALAASPPEAEATDGEELLRSLGLAARWPAFRTDGLVSVQRMLHALEQDPEGFDKQMALMGIKRSQRKLLVGALRQSAGAASCAPAGGAVGTAGDGYATEEDSEFDVDEFAGSGLVN